MATERKATIERKTAETRIKLELAVDGMGKCQASTGIGMLDHLIDQIARHGLFDITLEVQGDLEVGQHHTVEDVAICLGQAFDRALGERRGIVRMAHAMVPMDEALAIVAIDISGRGYAVVEAPLEGRDVGGLDTDLVRHFLESMAGAGGINLHARVVYGINDHHKVEALFKALGCALDRASRIDERIKGQLPSTKDLL